MKKLFLASVFTLALVGLSTSAMANTLTQRFLCNPVVDPAEVNPVVEIQFNVFIGHDNNFNLGIFHRLADGTVRNRSQQYTNYQVRAQKMGEKDIMVAWTGTLKTDKSQSIVGVFDANFGQQEFKYHENWYTNGKFTNKSLPASCMLVYNKLED